MCEINELEKLEISWPITQDVPTENLAQKIIEFSEELNGREQESDSRSLEAAQKIWPQLKKALKLNGREIGLNGMAEPIMPEWAKEPVVSVAGCRYGYKPKTKAQALKSALIFGDGGWATMGELWLWVGGGGPIVERTLQKFGYGKKETKNSAK